MLHIRGEKQKFLIHLKATGASKKRDKMKVGLFLNHIGDSCLEGTITSFPHGEN